MKVCRLIQWRSLQTRISLFTLAIFLLGLWTLAYFGSRMLREEMQSRLGEQQFSTVSILAAEISHEIHDRYDALKAVAAGISPAALRNAAALQALLEQRPLLLREFNGGAAVLDLEGGALADIPRQARRSGIDHPDAAGIVAPFREGQATVGRPHLGRRLQAPVLGMAVPIRDTHGRAIAVLHGVTYLDQPNFLQRIMGGRYGKTGAYLLVARQQRLHVTASDKSRIMEEIPASGIDPLIERFLQGHEGSGLLVNPAGVEMLSSAKGIAETDWYLAAALPIAEAFAPIQMVQQRMFLAAIILTLVAGGLTWWMVAQQLSPLLAAAKILNALPHGEQPPQALPVSRQDEIGELIGAFNRLLETLAQRETVLRESEEHYRAFFQHSPDAVFVHQNNLIIFANDAAARLLHAGSAAALLGRDWHELIAAEDWPVTEKRVAALTGGEATYLPPLERHYVALDGQVIVAESAAACIIFDGKPAVMSVIRDVTERRRNEAQRLAETRLQRDALVREVHHRIKNNLQSVAGLLQRELGQQVELNPRLAAAISQVHAIATVHGLQSSAPDEAIRLCESIRNICSTVSGLAQRPVLFRIEGEQTHFRAVRIESSEAVPVALVLNELILNAVKHSPEGSPDPTVALSADGSSAQIVMRNAVAGAPGFDFDSGAGLGTGLRLVRSLLPQQGARLRHERDADGYMLTSLTLTAPVVESVHTKEPDRT